MMRKICAILCCTILAIGVIKANDWAVVGVSTAYLRAQADYESALETQELMGSVVKILNTDRYWCQVESSQPYTAWCTDRVLVKMDSLALQTYEAAPKYVCVASVSKVLEKACKNAAVICDLVLCNRLRVGLNRCGKPLYQGKYAAVVLPSGQEGWVEKKDLVLEQQWREQGKPTRQELVNFARQFIGIPYLWGGMSPKGFDCSGLVRMVYLRHGIFLPRNASQMAKLGKKVEADALQAGDLLFFGVGEKITHVALYIGDGRFIHASHLVRINSLAAEREDVYENMHKLLFCRNILD